MAFSWKFKCSYKHQVAGFDLEVDLAIHAAVSSYTSIDVPISSYQDRPKGSYSKLNTFQDGMLLIRRIIFRYINYKFTSS